MENRSRKVLVIGGSGFVGGTLIPRLLEDGHDVTILNRGNRLIQGTKQLVADRTDKSQVRKAAENTGDFDVVIDTSSYNYQNTETAWANFAQKTKQWIHLGSAAVYKETPGRFPSEKDEIGGAKIWGEYGVEKSDVDQFLKEHSSEIPVTVLRPPYLYGPGNDNDRETFVWSRALQGRPIVVPSNGLTQIQFLHVEDLADIIKLAMNNKSKRFAVYNVASDECPTLREWVDMLSDMVGAKNTSVLAGKLADSYRPRQYFPFRDYPCCVENSLIKQELNWDAKYGIKDGFRQTFSKQNVEFLKTKELNTKVEDEILKTITVGMNQ